MDEQFTNRHDPNNLVREVRYIKAVDCFHIDSDPLNSNDGRSGGGRFIDRDEFGGHETTRCVCGILKKLTDIFGLLWVFLFNLVKNDGLGEIGQRGDDVGGVVRGHDFDQTDELVGVEIRQQLLGDHGVRFFDDDFSRALCQGAVNV
jgi:hypothetical protein